MTPEPSTGAGARPEKRPWEDAFDMAVEYARFVALALGLLIGGSIVRAHFDPKAALCSSYAGQAAQQGDTGAAANCGLNEFMASMGEAARWFGMAAVVLMVAVGAFQLYSLDAERRKKARDAA